MTSDAESAWLLYRATLTPHLLTEDQLETAEIDFKAGYNARKAQT